MTFQEILEGITRNRANPLTTRTDGAFVTDVGRKVDEIEWALQALAEALRDRDVAGH